MEEIDFKELLNLIWRRKIIIAILLVLGTICGYIYNNNLATPMYQTSTTVILSVKGDKEEITSNENETVTNDDIQLSENLMDTYQKIIKSNAVASGIKENLKSDLSEKDISNSISLKNDLNTMVIEIMVENESPEMAVKIANEVPNVFFEKISGVYNINNAEVLDKAEEPTEPCNINPIKFAVMGFIIGGCISTLIIFAEMIFNEKIKTEHEVEEKLKLPVLAKLGTVPEKEVNLVTANNSSCSEVFRVLLSNIKYLNPKVILTTSCNPSEGKSFVASNMAITYARSGKKTLLIDSDIRRGRQHSIFHINPYNEGISNLIQDSSDNIDFDKYITHVETVENLDIITKGTACIDYSKLLYTDKIMQLIEQLKQKYDFIIIDGTPKSLVADDIAFSTAVDYTILVVRYNRALLSEVKQIKNMETVKGKKLGVVLNGMPGISGKYQYSYYRYNNTNQLVVKKVKRTGELANRRIKTGDRY